MLNFLHPARSFSFRCVYVRVTEKQLFVKFLLRKLARVKPCDKRHEKLPSGINLITTKLSYSLISKLCTQQDVCVWQA